MSKKPYTKPADPTFEVVKYQQPPDLNKVSNEPPKIPMEFDAWFTIKHLPTGLKEALKYHMKARGFWESKDWDKGLNDFGIK